MLKEPANVGEQPAGATAVGVMVAVTPWGAARAAVAKAATTAILENMLRVGGEELVDEATVLIKRVGWSLRSLERR